MAVTADQRLCKQPLEKRLFTMDFTNVLGTGEGISVISGITSEKMGGYATDLSITGSGISSDTKKINMYIASGTQGTTYKVEVLVNTDASQTLEGDGILYITDR